MDRKYIIQYWFNNLNQHYDNSKIFIDILDFYKEYGFYP